MACLLPAGLRAQARPAAAVSSAPGRITGSVRGLDGQPLNGAAITVREADDSRVVAEVVTGKDGRFLVPALPLGRYLVQASYIGHEASAASAVVLAPGAPVRDVGQLELPLAPVALGELAVAAERAPIVIRADRTVYDPKAMPAAAGGSVADLLRHINELEVDHNGKVQLAGNRPVTIHINGRPAAMQGEQLDRFLTQLSGRLVSKVEVMPNPNASHDPEGAGGIVNIVLRDNVDIGVSGSFGINANTRGSRGLNGRVSLQKGRLTFFGGGSATIGTADTRIYDLRQNLISTPITFMEQDGRSRNDSHFSFADLSGEFRVGKQTIAWANGYAYGGGWDARANTLYAIYDVQDVPFDRYTRQSASEDRDFMLDLGLGLKHQFVPQKHELTVDFRGNTSDWGNASDAYKRLLLEGEAPGRELTANDTDNDYAGATLKLDYIRPWRQRGNVSMGVSLISREEDQHSTQRIFADEHDPAPGFSNSTEFVHETELRSLYLNASQVFGKYTIQAGVRGEFAATTFTVGSTAESFDNDYNSVFPNVSVARELATGRTLRIGYSKRIGRPSPFQLNPYRLTTDPLNRSAGNPYLKPNYTHDINADLSWTGKRGTLRIAPFYSRTVDAWNPLRTVDEHGVATVSPSNVASIRRVGSNLTASLRSQGRLSGSVNFAFSHVKNDASNLANQYANADWRWSTNSTLSAKLSSTLSATSTLTYWSRQNLPQGVRGAYLFSSVGIRQQLLAQKATLNLNLNDPLDLYRFRMEWRDRAHVQLSRNVPKIRAAALSVTYNFGKPPEQHSRRENVDTGELRQ